MAEIVQPRIFGVAEINSYLHEYLAEDEFLSQLAVRGEISSFRAHSSGHIYCTLKEKDSTIKMVMFRNNAQNLNWQPKDGDQVVVIGRIALYERDGTCQVYAEEIFPAGDGLQAQVLGKLKRQLEAEGIFDPGRKKLIPAYAFNIAVVTSSEGAAWADIQKVSFSRNPNINLQLYPATVQGELAASSLTDALAAADINNYDLIIVGRGGGANEDLSAFNQESVIRAIAQTKTPIIAAIGHESDFTLSDLAADISAATPSHAAMLAVADVKKIKERIDHMQLAMILAMERYISDLNQKLERLDVLDAVTQRISKSNNRLDLAIIKLEALSPLSTLKRGYSLVYSHQGNMINNSNQVNIGDKITIYPAFGKINAVVEDKDNG